MAIKKVSQTSAKKSKKEKKEFNSLIRLLRPKVYITDSSSFKRLVQDLTGNGSSDVSVTTSPYLQKQQDVLVEEEEIVIVDVEEYQGGHERSTSVDVPTDASFNSSRPCNQQVLMNEQELNQLGYLMYSDDTATTTNLEGFVSTADQEVFMNDQLCHQMYSDDTSTTTTLEASTSTADQFVDMLPFQDLESWLLGTEPFDPFNYGCGQIDQEFSIYDYELSGIL